MSTNDLIDTMYLLADKITNLVGQRQFENLPDYMKRTAISDAYRSEVDWSDTSDVDDALLTVINEFLSNAETGGVDTPLLTRVAKTASDLNQIRLYPELLLDSVTRQVAEASE